MKTQRPFRLWPFPCAIFCIYLLDLNDHELFLAADVFDAEPVPLDHKLLQLENVIHTPHMAGRTYDSNISYAEDIMQLFKNL